MMLRALGLLLVACLLPQVGWTQFVYTVSKTADTADGVCDSDCSLREAIDAANAAASAIVEIPGGAIYRIQLIGADDSNAAGDFDILSPMTIMAQPGTGTPIIDANGAVTQDRAFDSRAAVGSVTFSGLEIINGAPTGSLPLNGGGAIRQYSGTVDVSIVDCVFTSNQGSAVMLQAQGTVSDSFFDSNVGGWGGALWAYGYSVIDGCTFVNNSCTTHSGAVLLSSGEIHRSVFDSNSSTSSGGALGLHGDAYLEDNLFTNNIGGYSGGAIWVGLTANVEMVNCDIASSRAGRGGGVGNGGSLAMTLCEVYGNSATDYGGGVYNTGDSLTVFKSRIYGNSAASHGGGVYALGGAIDIDRSEIAENHSGGKGGGLALGNGTTGIVTNSTLSGNVTSTPSGGGLYNEGWVALEHVTFADNWVTSHGLRPNALHHTGAFLRTKASIVSGGCSGSAGITSLGSNVDPTASCGFGASMDTTGPAATTLLDFRGGPTRTHGLLFVSAAESNATACPAIDQRGFPRNSGICDSGAFELVKSPR